MEKLENDVRMLMGLPPYNSPGNICWNDAYFARAIKEKYGEKAVEDMIKKLEKLKVS